MPKNSAEKSIVTCFAIYIKPPLYGRMIEKYFLVNL